MEWMLVERLESAAWTPGVYESTTANERHKPQMDRYGIMMMSRRATPEHDNMHLLRRKLAITTARVNVSIHRTYDQGSFPRVCVFAVARWRASSTCETEFWI